MYVYCLNIARYLHDFELCLRALWFRTEIFRVCPHHHHHYHHHHRHDDHNDDDDDVVDDDDDDSCSSSATAARAGAGATQ